MDTPDTDLYPPPYCPFEDCGHSERFFQGILLSGAAPYFDVVPYHAYSTYVNLRVDYDTDQPHGRWNQLGGVVLGKARFLRSVMSQYGVDKPVAVDEIALTCPNDLPWATFCSPPENNFYQMQADFLVRSYVRGFNGNIYSYIWYTLDDTWRYGGLLNNENNPRLSYLAYQQLIIHLRGTSYNGPYTYGAGIEAYAFDYMNQQIHVIWSMTDTSHSINLPKSEFVAAYTRDGASITPTPIGSDYQLQVTFDPIYLIRSH
jgi:hypothetical protein